MIRVRWSGEGGWTLPVRVTPKGGRDAILPFQVGDDSVRLKVSAPPEEGKANAAVQSLLAKTLGLPKRSLLLIQGETSRQKRFMILSEDDVAPDEFLQPLARAMGLETPAEAFQIENAS